MHQSYFLQFKDFIVVLTAIISQVAKSSSPTADRYWAYESNRRSRAEEAEQGAWSSRSPAGGEGGGGRKNSGGGGSRATLDAAQGSHSPGSGPEEEAMTSKLSRAHRIVWNKIEKEASFK